MVSIFKHYSLTFVVIGLVLSGCTNNKFKVQKLSLDRQLASDQGSEQNIYHQGLKEQAAATSRILEFPPGVNAKEQFEMWHASEGSDIYPTLWLLNLKSFLSSEKNSFFFENLDQKYGVIKSPYEKDSFTPYGWIGLTAVWDGENYEEQDLFLSRNYDFKNLDKIRKLKNGKPVIAMTGANCAYCHTGAVTDSAGNKNPQIIDGAPATIDMKGFFYDIIGSTYQTMFNQKELIAFYERMKVDNAANKATDFVLDLKKELGVEDSLMTEAIALLIKTPFLGKKINESVMTKAATLFYEKKDILTKYLTRLLKETYDLKEITPLMQKRMEYLTWFGAPNPDVITSPEGFGRTDAFGRISNATIRTRSYTHLTAPVSLPPMYAMKYKAFYHYNANTNSLVSRNIGQAFGLGAVVTGEVNGDPKKVSSTVNIPNLIKLEKLINKVPVPEYVTFFPAKKIKKDLMALGCNVYLNKCIQCHEAHEERVGPQKILIDHKMVKLDIIDTDRQYIKNISKTALGLPFRKAIFDFTDKVKDGYYTEYAISSATQKDYAQEDARSTDIFRDTYLGESRFDKTSDLSYTNIEPGFAYVARHLAGVWSTAPYLHNGSVPNLYELLLPSNKRTKNFIVGNLQYDHENLGFISSITAHPFIKQRLKGKSKTNPCYDRDDPYCFDASIVGNSNTGHEPSMYGGELKQSEKLALIEFLKVVAPESENSWKSIPLYKIENNKCFIR